jgi:molybdopterin/thiamine biosynthesis adenylyltransferase
MALSEQQLLRYSRNIILKEIDGVGQEKLLNSKVLVIGAGGLGSPTILYLAAAGVGTIGIADGDLVDYTNLQRQVIHSTADLGKQKTISAKEKVSLLNPDVTVKIHPQWITEDNIDAVISDYDFVIDGTDNFDSKFLINDSCCLLQIPFSHAGVAGFEGQTITVSPNHSACYRCIFKASPPPIAVPSCSQAGVLGAWAGLLGIIQATEAVKCLLGIGNLLLNTLLICNALEMSFRKVTFHPNPSCPVCGKGGLTPANRATCN